MKVIFLAFFISMNLAASTIPLELLGPANTNSVLFKEMRNYMFQVFQRSQIFRAGQNCILLKYDHLERPQTERDLKFCLITKVGEKKIEQTLVALVFNRPAGSFKFVQEGVNLSPLSLGQFSKFQIPDTAIGVKSQFLISHFTFALEIDRIALPESVNAYFQNESFKINMFEDLDGKKRFRNYLASCSHCTGMTWLKVQADQEGINYFTGSDFGEVTPAHFNGLLNAFIFRPLDQFGMQIKENLNSEMNWPVL